MEKLIALFLHTTLEHIPNPIKFLKTCQKLLKKNGNLILALPDYRCCWDRFRPLTSCADWIQSYHEDSDKPSAKQIFLQNSMHCRWNDNGILRATMPLGTELCDLIPLETLEKAYQNIFQILIKEILWSIPIHTVGLLPQKAN